MELQERRELNRSFLYHKQKFTVPESNLTVPIFFVSGDLPGRQVQDVRGGRRLRPQVGDHEPHDQRHGEVHLRRRQHHHVRVPRCGW